MLILLMLMHGYNAGTLERNQLLCGDSVLQLGCNHLYLPGGIFAGIFYIDNEIIRVKTLLFPLLIYIHFISFLVFFHVLLARTSSVLPSRSGDVGTAALFFLISSGKISLFTTKKEGHIFLYEAELNNQPGQASSPLPVSSDSSPLYAAP